MIDLTPKHLEMIQRILAEHVPECEVRAFGSRVKWAAKDYSDLDLAVVGSEPLSRRQLRRLIEAFEESDVPIRVDVVDWQSLSDWFKEVIAAEYKVIQRAEPVGGLLKLRNASKAIVDCEHKTAPIEALGIPSIRTTDIKNGRIDLQNANKVSQETYHEWTKRMEPRPSDLILSREAPVGEVGIVPEGAKVCLGQRTVLIRPDCEKVVPRYLLYLLLTREMKHEMTSRAEGSIVPHLNMSDIRDLEIPVLPPLDEQRRVAHILGTLDEKIELNRQMNETLEAIARAIFKSWFVDFDPVRAKMEGRMPAGMDAATATLFPSAFQDSPLGKIPKGWEVATVGEEFNLTMGQSPPGSTYNEAGDGLPFYQGRKDFGFRYPTRRVYCNAPTRVAKKDDTLVSVRAPVGDINMAEEKCCIGRGAAAIRHKTGSRSYTYYAMQFLREDFSLYEAEGTVFGAINKTGFQTLSQLRPSDGIIEAFERLVYPLDQSIENNKNQSRTLSQIRDALLPKLLSGEIRVDNIDKRLEVKNGGTS